MHSHGNIVDSFILGFAADSRGKRAEEIHRSMIPRCAACFYDTRVEQARAAY